MEYTEYIGYRANASDQPKNKKGVVTVYAERRNNMSALGEYGGDAYPFVYEERNDESNLTYGMAVAADGVGQGAYTHASLKKFLQDCPKELPTLYEKNPTETLLYKFLTELYGKEIFEEKNNDALQYALRCFADVPCDGYFASDIAKWANSDSQIVRHFYDRDSQSLGSRIVCVGLYLKFRNWHSLKNLQMWDKTSAKAKDLRSKIENYLSGELRTNVFKIFNHSDAPDTTKRNYYFLCSTVAVWFYIANDNTKTVSALSLNCGDARCYVADLQDGVRQISIDDAFDDGAMSAFVHFGAAPRLQKPYHDGKFHARIVELQYPCALLACSDGVYDTCPAAMPSDESKYSFAYGEKPESNDFLFEYNMLCALRNCHSMEDFSREVAFNFYGQANTKCAESTTAGNYAAIKKDDSGTLAGKFFGARGGLELLEKLRLKQDTRIDRLFDKLNEHIERGNPIPYYKPHASSSSEKQKAILDDYATGTFKSATINILKNVYPAVFQEMCATGEKTLWGVEDCTTPLTGFKLNMFLCKQANLVAMLQKAMEVYEPESTELAQLQSKSWESVLSVEEAAQALHEAEFEKFVEKYKNSSDKGGDDEKLQQYKEFCKYFYGEGYEDISEKYEEVVGADECKRKEFTAEN